MRSIIMIKLFPLQEEDTNYKPQVLGVKHHPLTNVARHHPKLSAQAILHRKEPLKPTMLKPFSPETDLCNGNTSNLNIKSNNNYSEKSQCNLI
jgi:hypothetical protein